MSFLLLALAVLPLGSCSRQESSAAPAASTGKVLYTCGMHPQIVQDHPGDCPICGMHLEPIRQQPETAEHVAPSETSTSSEHSVHSPTVISIDPVTIQNMNIRTAVLARGPLNRELRAAARVDYAEDSLVDVTLRYQGWIERLFVSTTGSSVRTGDALLEIHSPELVAAQSEYLVASTPALKASALRKLEHFQLSAEQIAGLEDTGVVRQSVTVHAPRSGVVVEKDAVQGQMVDPGARLYRLADLSTVWVLAALPEADFALVQPGQEAQITFPALPGQTFRARVAFVDTAVDDKTRTGKARLVLDNPTLALKPGMFAVATLALAVAPDALLVPESAVLRSGERNTVFVAKEGGKFEPRTVQLGARGEAREAGETGETGEGKGGVYPVLRGLEPGERVVTSGQFLLDSESQLQEAIQKMREPGK